MKNESSHLASGMVLGLIVGACATYFIIKNKETIKRGLENMSDKVKDGVQDFAHKAKEKAEEFGEKAKNYTEKASEKVKDYVEKTAEKANKTAGSSDYKSQTYNESTTGKTY